MTPNDPTDGDWGMALYFDRTDGLVETTRIGVTQGALIEVKTLV